MNKAWIISPFVLAAILGGAYLFMHPPSLMAPVSAQEVAYAEASVVMHGFHGAWARFVRKYHRAPTTMEELDQFEDFTDGFADPQRYRNYVQFPPKIQDSLPHGVIAIFDSGHGTFMLLDDGNLRELTNSQNQ